MDSDEFDSRESRSISVVGEHSSRSQSKRQALHHSHVIGGAVYTHDHWPPASYDWQYAWLLSIPYFQLDFKMLMMRRISGINT